MTSPGRGPEAAGDPVTGDAGDNLGAPDHRDPAGEILRSLDGVRGLGVRLIVPVQGQPHLTLVNKTNVNMQLCSEFVSMIFSHFIIIFISFFCLSAMVTRRLMILSLILFVQIIISRPDTVNHWD